MNACAMVLGSQAVLVYFSDIKHMFIVVSNTGQDNFTAAMRYHVAEGVEPEILFLSAREFGRVSIRGDLMEAAEAREAVLRFVERE